MSESKVGAKDLTFEYTSKKFKSANGEYLNPNFVLLEKEIGNYREFVLQGSGRSGKTWSVLFFIWKLIQNYNGLDIGICRATTPTLNRTVVKDFIEIGSDEKVGLCLFNERNYNRTKNIYSHNGNTVEFFALDDEGKARGAKRHILYMNEANQLDWALVSQLLVRTTNKVIMDYNPSDIDSWIYDNMLTRESACLLKTTYLQNPHLTKEILDEFEWMRINDPDKYRWQGLGERAIRQGQIYSNWSEIKEGEFEWDRCKLWGIDFGATIDPTVIGRCYFEGKNIYVQELVCETNIRSFQIMIHLFFKGFNKNRHTLIGDGGGVGATFIQEMRGQNRYELSFLISEAEKLGYSFINMEQKLLLLDFVNEGVEILKARKPKGSIIGGIDMVKNHKVWLDTNSTNAWQEYYRYAWKVKDEKVTKEPIDSDNHFMDMLRYMVMDKDRLFY